MLLLQACRMEWRILSVSMMLSVLLTLPPVYLMKHKRLEYNSSQASLSRSRLRYHDAMEKIRILENNDKAFSVIKASGLVGEENRADWIRQIDRIANKTRIVRLDYQIDERKKINNPLLKADYPGINIYRSRMTLDMDVLHEGDFLRFMEHLGDAYPDTLDIDSCHLKPLYTDIKKAIENKKTGNINIRCEAGWISISVHD